MLSLKLSKSTTYTLFSISLVSIALSQVLYAQTIETEQDIIELEKVISVGSIQSFMTTEQTNKYTTSLTNSTIGIPQDLKDTTQTISIITNQRMYDQPDLNRVIDVVDNATGLTSQQNDLDRFSISSRGMNVDSISYDGVTNYYDTCFNYGDNLMDTALYDRVEIVRGATGFMTGPGNPSASINLVRKRPTQDFQGYVSVGGGSWNLWRLELDVSGKLNKAGNIRGRLVGLQQHRESFIDRYKEKRQTLYGIIEIDLSSQTLLTLGTDFQRNRPNGTMSGGLPLFYSDGTLTNYDHSVNTAPKWASARTKSLNSYITFEHEFDNGWRTELNFTHSRNHLDFNNTYVAGAPNPINNGGLITSYINHINGTRTQKTVDWKLNGTYNAFGKTHFARFNYNYNQNSYNNAYYNPVPGSLPPTIGDFAQSGFDYPQPEWLPDSFTALRGKRTQHAFSGITELTITDQISLTAGLRWTHLRTNDDSYGPYFKPYDNSFNELSKYFGLNYKITEQYSVYASYTDIFQPQSVMDASGQYLDPIIGKNYEAGFKAAFNDGALNFSLAAFEIRRDNVAEATGERLPSGDGIYRAVNGAKTRGFDIELAGAITDNWNIQVGYTSFRAKNAKKQRISQQMPNETFKLFTTYRLSGALNGMTIGGGVNWLGSTSMPIKTPKGLTPFS